MATDKDNGILLYKEDHDPLALELYQGHIRLIYDIASYPPTTVYRYHMSLHYMFDIYMWYALAVALCVSVSMWTLLSPLVQLSLKLPL